MKTIETVYCAAITPMNENYTIDYAGLAANIEWYVNNRLGGVLICGGTGEFVSLSTKERLEIAERSSQMINGRTGFVVGCAAETTMQAIEFAKHAASIGADGVMLIASYYFKPSEEELFQHFTSVANAVQIPVILYNNPGACGTNLSPAFVKRVMTACGNVRYLKEATGDLMHFRSIQDACGDDFHLIAGCDALAYELLVNGAKGWISISANALAAQSQSLFDCVKERRFEQAWEIFHRLLPLYTVCESPYKAVQTVKYMMDQLGCCGGPSRLPRLELTPAEQKDIDRKLKQALVI